jgi:hypothetical protein
MPDEGPKKKKPQVFTVDICEEQSTPLPWEGYTLQYMGRGKKGRFNFEIIAPHSEKEKITYPISAARGKPGKKSYKWMPFSIEIATTEDPTTVKVTVTEREGRLEKYSPPGNLRKAFVHHLPSLTLATLTAGLYTVTNVLVPEVKETVDASGLPQFLKSYLYQAIVPITLIAISAWVFVDEIVRKKEIKR